MECVFLLLAIRKKYWNYTLLSYILTLNRFLFPRVDVLKFVLNFIITKCFPIIININNKNKLFQIITTMQWKSTSIFRINNRFKAPPLFNRFHSHIFSAAINCSPLNHGIITVTCCNTRHKSKKSISTHKHKDTERKIEMREWERERQRSKGRYRNRQSEECNGKLNAMDYRLSELSTLELDFYRLSLCHSS